MSMKKSTAGGALRNIHGQRFRRWRSNPRNCRLKAHSWPPVGELPGSVINLVIEGGDPAFLDAIRSALGQVRADLPQGCHLNVRFIPGMQAAPFPGTGPGDGQEALADLPALTARQHDILELLTTGLSNKEIGRKLNLSHFTVRNHISQIMRLMGVSTRQEIIARTAAHTYGASSDRGQSGRERHGQHDF